MTRPGFGHALLAPLVVNAFEGIGVSVTLWDGREWLPIHEQPLDVTRFEFKHKLGAERASYNERCLAEVRRTGKADGRRNPRALALAVRSRW